MLTQSMLRRFAACWIAAAIVAGAGVVSRPAHLPKATQAPAEADAAVQAEILREVHLGKQVVSREVDGRIVIEAVGPAGVPLPDGMRVAALRRAGAPRL